MAIVIERSVRSALRRPGRYLTSLVEAARRADPVRDLRLPAVGTLGERLRLEEVVGAAQVAARLAVSVLGIRHGDSPGSRGGIRGRRRARKGRPTPSFFGFRGQRDGI